VLGEHFRAHWDVIPLSHPEELIERPSLQHERHSSSASVQSGSYKSTLSVNTTDLDSVKPGQAPSTAPTSPEPRFSSDNNGPSRIRVVYLTEQVSHHPPVSAYYASCPAR
jgi:hypothetical protein